MDTVCYTFVLFIMFCSPHIYYVLWYTLKLAPPLQTILDPPLLKLVGMGTNGSATNIVSAGLRGLVEKDLLWIFWMWCMAHKQQKMFSRRHSLM